MFSNSSIGILLFFTHMLSAISVGFILGLYSRIKSSSENSFSNIYINNDVQSCSLKDLGSILSDAILESSKTIIMIGGFVVIFSVIISILKTSKVLQLISYSLYPILDVLKIDSIFSIPIISGIIELTNGISLVTSTSTKTISTNIILCAFLLGFGGLSVLLQVLSIASNSDLSIKKYIYGKVLQGIIAAIYTYILITLLPMFNLNL